MLEQEFVLRDIGNWIMETPVKDRKLKDIKKKIKKEGRGSMKDLTPVKKLLNFDEVILEPKYRQYPVSHFAINNHNSSQSIHSAVKSLKLR